MPNTPKRPTTTSQGGKVPQVNKTASQCVANDRKKKKGKKGY